jgi:hypothetical protein
MSDDGVGGRPATERERAVRLRMIEPLGAAGAGLRGQVAGARVSGGCECGCPTIYFARGAGTDVMAAGTAGTVDVTTASIAGSDDFLVLFVAGPWLDALEYVPVGDEIPAELPAPELLDAAVVTHGTP